MSDEPKPRTLTEILDSYFMAWIEDGREPPLLRGERIVLERLIERHVAAERRQGRREERERCEKAQCRECRDGVPYDPKMLGGVHIWGEGDLHHPPGYYRECYARKIRALPDDEETK